MKIAIVHDYLHQFGGAEKVIEKWLQIFPKADIYTSLHTPETFKNSPEFELAYKEKRIKTSFAQKLIANKKMIRYFKHFFWLYPLAMSFVKVKDYDLVLISSTYCAKNIKLENNKQVFHYCHSPTRFLHGLVTETDHKSLSRMHKFIIPFFKFWLKRLDLKAVENLNKNNCVWFGNSKFIQKTIKEVYKVDSFLLYPPIELQRFLKIKREDFSETKNSFYLCHGRISFHKRIDLAIKACLQMGRKLKISGGAGSQMEMDQLKNIVKEFEKEHPEKKGLVEFLGRTSDEELSVLMSKCRAFLFPGKEDFGIAPIEVLASGVPIIAYKAGGALEYIKPNKNGIFFEKQEVECLIGKIQEFEKIQSWDEQEIKNTTLSFSEERFRKEFLELVKK